MKILLIYPPFCTPTIMPYSISYLKAFLQENTSHEIKALDLNAKFHKMRFKGYYEKIKKADDEDYGNLLEDFYLGSKDIYAENNNKVLKGKKPELFDEILSLIVKEKPDLVAISLVYSSQAFYAKALIDALEQKDIKIVVGGPAVSDKIREKALCIPDEIGLLKYLDEDVKQAIVTADFSDYDKEDYLSKHTIIPVKSSSGCPYQRCAFCTHHNNIPYYEYPLDDIAKSRYYFFIDDMITNKRLREIAAKFKGTDIRWWAQLRPTIDIIPLLPELHGLKSVAWGVESASQKILDKMRKGTKVEDIEKVLTESKKAGMINIVYIMFGFPTETKVDFMQTIDFLRKNRQNIDLVSASIFGLHKNSPIYKSPEEFSITGITETPRTVLDPKLGYEAREGLSIEEAARLKKRFSKELASFNKLPRIFNYMKEQTLFC